MTQPIEEQVADLVAASNQLTNAVENKVTEIDLLVSDALAVFKANHKNLIVDGRFDFWYEGALQASGDSGYGSDTMAKNESVGCTRIHTQRALTIGTDIPGVPTAKFYSRTDISANGASISDRVRKIWNVEDVRTLAGKKAVFSMYARADLARDIVIEVTQIFGSGGSAVVYVPAVKKTIGITNFARYDFVFDIPAISGKTIGDDSKLEIVAWFSAGSTFNGRTFDLGFQTGWFDVACVQLEEGAESSKFKEEDQQESLSRVNRYFWEFEGNDDDALITTTTQGIIGGGLSGVYQLPSLMRSIPSITYNSIRIISDVGSEAESLVISANSKNSISFNATHSSVAGHATLEGAGSFLRADARL